MRIKVKYIEAEYVRDYKKYMFYIHKKTLIEIFFVALLLAIFLFFDNLNQSDQLDFLPLVFQIGKYGLWVGLGILILFEVLSLVTGLVDIRKTSKQIPVTDESMFFNSTNIEYTWNSQRVTCFWSSYKEAVILNETLFLIPNSRKGVPVRINLKEVGEGGFKFALDEVQKRMVVKK